MRDNTCVTINSLIRLHHLPPNQSTSFYLGVSHPPNQLDLVRNAIRVHRHNCRTTKAYVDRIRRLIICHGKKRPTEMAGAQVTATTQGQALAASLSVYKRV